MDARCRRARGLCTGAFRARAAGARVRSRQGAACVHCAARVGAAGAPRGVFRRARAHADAAARCGAVRHQIAPDHLASYQVSAALQSTTRSTSSGLPSKPARFFQGFSIAAMTAARARSAVSRGPSSITSS